VEDPPQTWNRTHRREDRPWATSPASSTRPTSRRASPSSQTPLSTPSRAVSEGDAQHLKDAFNITTIRDLGTNKHFLWAQAITKLAD
jgi:hypothetical protein